MVALLRVIQLPMVFTFSKEATDVAVAIVQLLKKVDTTLCFLKLMNTSFSIFFILIS